MHTKIDSLKLVQLDSYSHDMISIKTNPNLNTNADQNLTLTLNPNLKKSIKNILTDAGNRTGLSMFRLGYLMQ